MALLQKRTPKLISTHALKRKLPLYAYLRELLKIDRLAFAWDHTYGIFRLWPFLD